MRRVWLFRRNSAGTTAIAGSATSLGIRLGACFAENLRNAFASLLALRQGCALGAWHLHQQISSHRLDRDFLLDERFDVRQTLGVDLAGKTDRVALGTHARGTRSEERRVGKERVSPC